MKKTIDYKLIIIAVLSTLFFVPLQAQTETEQTLPSRAEFLKPKRRVHPSLLYLLRDSTESYYQATFAQASKKTPQAGLAISANIDQKTLNIIIELQSSKTQFSKGYVIDNQLKGVMKKSCYRTILLILDSIEERGIFKDNEFKLVNFDVTFIDGDYLARNIKFKVDASKVSDLRYPFSEYSFVQLLFN